MSTAPPPPRRATRKSSPELAPPDPLAALSTVFIFNTVIKELAELRQSPLVNLTEVNLLNSIRIICGRTDVRPTIVCLCNFMRVNKRGYTTGKLWKDLEVFQQFGYITYTKHYVHITEFGLAAILEINNRLKSSHCKYLVTDTGVTRPTLVVKNHSQRKALSA